EDLPKTFKLYVEKIRETLLSFKSQMDDCYNSCLTGFQDQVKQFEKELPCILQLAADCLFKEHEQKLSHSIGQIQHLFTEQLQYWEKTK
ncbi:CC180 protein, partial [Upupa epops]|nr:CC180 protein [Upupa epops]